MDFIRSYFGTNGPLDLDKKWGKKCCQACQFSLSMHFTQESIPESLVKKNRIDKVIQLLLKPCTFYTL